MYIKFVYCKYKHLKTATETVQTLNNILNIKIKFNQ